MSKIKDEGKPKVIISWIAINNDFKDGQVNRQGPTFSLHRLFYSTSENHVKHILLRAETGNKINAEQATRLLKSLKDYKEFKTHNIELVQVKIDDVISFEAIMPKIETILMDIKDDYDIDLFISPGTPMMQVCWVIAHLNGIARTRLFQARRPEHSKRGIQVEFFETHIQRSTLPFLVAVKAAQDQRESTYLTDGIDDVINKAKQVATRSDVSVLIMGETGTGKEGLAKIVKDTSPRSNQPYIALNCAAFNDTLLLSELFGSVKGSFTGAIDRKGYFETLHGGTIFLDEIGDISPYMQAVLLRVLQDGTYYRLGEVKPRKTDVRIIAATNRDLYQEAMNNRFRLDLYYRLAQTKLFLPPLRERGKESLQNIVKNKWKFKALKYYPGKEILMSESVMKSLTDYHYPGNLRELDNILDELFIYCQDGVINEEDVRRILPFNSGDFYVETDTGLDLDYIIRRHCRSIYKKTGNKSVAAKLLKISVNTLNKYLS